VSAVVALLVAVVGSLTYLLWPGTLAWYGISLFGAPVVVVLYWMADDDDSPTSPDFFDGPYTAP
jgi:hypothetical protein